MDLLPFPDKRYQIIYADPPWSYRDKARAGKRGVEYKYKVPTQAWLEGLPVYRIADENCALFLWVTMPKLSECWDLIGQWGFTYKTAAFNWVKRNRKSPSWFWGMGNFTRSNPELCLLAMRGKLKRKSASVHSVIDSPVRKHSEKPDEVRNRIVELFGDLPRIELFARKRIDGWDAWGDEV